MAIKLRYCPNCKQNVMPKGQTRIGQGCLVFIGAAVLGLAFLVFQLVPGWLASCGAITASEAAGLDAASEGLGSTLVVLCLGCWAVGLGALIVLGRSQYHCPMCNLPRSELRRAL